jgi:transcriptional regulator with XRE-family HTH domain
VSRLSGPQNSGRRLQEKIRSDKVWVMLKKTGLKRAKIAEMLGVSLGYLNQVQYGHSPMSKPLRRKLSRLFNMTEQDLFEDWVDKENR